MVDFGQQVHRVDRAQKVHECWKGPQSFALFVQLNVYVGLGLILGLFSRVALWCGIVLLTFYYLSHPPFIGLKFNLPMEGSYLVVNKNLIEIAAMVVLLLFPTSRMIGIDRLVFKEKNK